MVVNNPRLLQWDRQIGVGQLPQDLGHRANFCARSQGTRQTSGASLSPRMAAMRCPPAGTRRSRCGRWRSVGNEPRPHCGANSEGKRPETSTTDPTAKSALCPNITCTVPQAPRLRGKEPGVVCFVMVLREAARAKAYQIRSSRFHLSARCRRTRSVFEVRTPGSSTEIAHSIPWSCRGPTAPSRSDYRP